MILKTAETIVINEGLSALNARRIAMTVGYTVGSIYMVFDNMADLLLHVKSRTLDDIALHLEQIQNLDAAQSIEELAKAYLIYANQNFNRWQMIFENPLSKETTESPWYQQKIDHIFSLIEKQFARLAPQGSSSQNKRAARALWGGVHGICSLSLSGTLEAVGVDDVEESVVLLVRCFIQGWASSSTADR